VPLLAGTLLLVASAFALAESRSSAPQPAAPIVSAPPAAPAPSAPPATAVPASPPSPVQGIRNKIAAGDLLSAESILEVHRAENGEDAAYLSGLAWLMRGALLLGDRDKATTYLADVRQRCDAALAAGARLDDDHGLEIALGATIEVQAQLIERRSGARKAAAYVRNELAGIHGPVALRARLNKRLNLLTLVGTPAPELAIEDSTGEPAPTLASLKGRPVMLFVFAEWCGDCKGQERALARVRRRHTDDIAFVALTRYYDDEDKRAEEKERILSVWKSVYADVGPAPIVISTASMVRYGGSSTPTFVFIDRAGIVRGYTPTRLTEAEIDRALAGIFR
jgi:thiol-disulfide isomerase/thioredoxin